MARSPCTRSNRYLGAHKKLPPCVPVRTGTVQNSTELLVPVPELVPLPSRENLVCSTHATGNKLLLSREASAGFILSNDQVS